MLHRIKNKLLKNHSIKSLAMVICTLLISTFTIGSTYALVISDTPSLVNKFVNGVNPTGDLIVQKQVTHPFGDTYIMPEELEFSYEVNLGVGYAGKTVKTTQGEKTADGNGVVSITVAPGGKTTVFNISKDTAVKVTEVLIPAGFTPEAKNLEVVIQRFQDNVLSFNNIYSPAGASTSRLAVKGEKNLIGRDWMEGDKFTFQLDVYENDQWKSLGTQSVVYELVEQPDTENTQDPEATVIVPKENFNKFDFTEIIQSYPFSSLGMYKFRVTEIEGAVGGMTYDKAVSEFEIHVGDADMDGYLEIQTINTLSANTTIENTDVYITFSNEYAPVGSADVYINIEKVLESTSGQSKLPAGFTFELFDEQGNLLKTSEPSDSDGKTSIRLVYEPSEAGKEYIYVLKETNAGQTIDYITYDSTEYKLKVTVVDNLDGTISANISDYKEEEPEQPALTPDNTEADEADTAINGEQSVTPDNTVADESDSSEGDNIEENIEPSDEEIVDNGENAVEENADDADDSNADNQNNVSENEGAEQSEENIQSDDLVIPTGDDTEISDTTNNPDEVIINEDANEDSEQDIEPEVSCDEIEDEQPEEIINIYQFKNIYDPQDTSVIIEGKKLLSGRDLRDKEFSFYLYQTDNNFNLPNGAKPVEVVQNDINGTVKFSELSFEKVGTSYYTVFENSEGNLGGITYDKTIYHITVTVRDNNGILEHAVYITDSYGEEKNIEFVNTYKAEPAYLTLPGTKILNGADLIGDDFFFQLYAADETFNINGNLLKTVANNADGDFEFKDICFETAGTYRFVVKEDTSKEKEGITYDESIYCITADITDPGNGQLVISGFGVTKSGETVSNIVFENIYTATVEPDEPDIPDEPEIPDTPDIPDTPTTPDIPDTGDNTNVLIYIGAFAGAAIAVVIVLIFKRYKKDEDNQ